MVQQLLTLFGRSSDPCAIECSRALRDSEDEVYSAGLVPVSHAVRIYTRRAKSSPEIVRGIDSVLENLRSTDVQDVQIYGLNHGNRHYVIFTNADTTRLFGVGIVEL